MSPELRVFCRVLLAISTIGMVSIGVEATRLVYEHSDFPLDALVTAVVFLHFISVTGGRFLAFTSAPSGVLVGRRDWRFVGGRLEHRDSDSKMEWVPAEDYCWDGDVDTIRLLADLIANPTELVDDDGSAPEDRT